MASSSVRVFVSHHHSPDEDVFTARLVADLEAAGADVWVDTAGISSGSFVAKISEGLAGRQWLVLVMTPASLASPWVRREVEAAFAEHTSGRMLGVIPLVMQPCQEQDIPLLWRPLHRINSARDYTGALTELLRAIGLPASGVQDVSRATSPTVAHSQTPAASSAPPELSSTSPVQHVVIPWNGRPSHPWIIVGTIAAAGTLVAGVLTLPDTANVTARVVASVSLFGVAGVILLAALIIAVKQSIATRSWRWVIALLVTLIGDLYFGIPTALALLAFGLFGPRPAKK